MSIQLRPLSFPVTSIFFSGHRQILLRRRGLRMDTSTPPLHKDKLLVIMGPTGCGKTKLSVDLASRFPSEIINSDKIQVYSGLDITTNKISIPDRRGVPHHLLGVFDPHDGELTPCEFRFTAGFAVSDICARQKLPLLVGGSNSFIHALLVHRFNPEFDVFKSAAVAPISTQLRYDCCFLWVDVSFPVLCDYLCRRVDEMLDLGMFEDLSEFYRAGELLGEDGIRKAIGVPEFGRYFKKRPSWTGGDDKVRRGAYEEAVREIKINTCQLAKRQIGKIMKLRNAGWDLRRIDATASFREVMRLNTEEDDGKNNRKKKRKKKRWIEIWEKQVLEPSLKIVNRFLQE